ncbi:ABC transporter ATP-binding protein [Tianweitania sediminis]|uniref:ABC transporter ATP-binding protein n=1 Tax=Tianweitania sediminis TaxID=1502156 RepID=A0A8J7UGM9_9HYPH|nr:ABC transporter ATP-binding protein [Tianweitania sediminis]MBP0438349.1 ABC transporter ATP-binding protein [Tianweitania sediminis]
MAEPLLQLRGLKKSFGALLATDNVSLTLRPGEIHALIGPNGAGKTTLIHQIAGTLQPDEGELRFAGQDITSLHMADRVQLGLARTFQVSSVLPEFSALRNVMLAVQARQGTSFRFFADVRRDARLTDAAAECLARAGLDGRAAVPAAELSHGERRRLEIAIALATGPRALLLDEPMAGLGPEGSKDLVVLLNALRSEVPMLLVEHDMDAVFALADRISVLVYGRVIATGTADEIRRHPEVRAAYLGDDA